MINLGFYLIWFNFDSIKHFDVKLFYIDNISRGLLGFSIDVNNHNMRHIIKKSIEIDFLYFKFKKRL